jgi:hypothetical protein
VNLSYGARTGFDDDTVRTKTPGGAALYDARRRERTDAFQLDSLTQAEGLASVRKMQRQLGKSGQVFFVFDPSDSSYSWERNYLAVLKELTPLQYTPITAMSAGFSLVEDL